MRPAQPQSQPHQPCLSAQDLPYLVYDREAWGGAQCWNALITLDTTPEVLAEMDALELIAQMVEDGAAQAVVPRWDGLSRYCGTQFSALEGHSRRIGMLLHQRDAESATTRLLRRALQSV